MVCLHSMRITVTITCRIYLCSISRTQVLILSHLLVFTKTIQKLLTGGIVFILKKETEP